MKRHLPAAVFLAAASIALADAPTTQSAATLTIDSQLPNAKPLTLSLEEVAKLPHQSLTVTDRHAGGSVTYSGVPLHTLLLQAGAPLTPDQLRGKNLSLYLLAEGADGYQAVIALPEIDPTFTSQTILVADHINNQPLDPRSGPFKLIIPQDKKTARWVRMLIALHLRKAN